MVDIIVLSVDDLEVRMNSLTKRLEDYEDKVPNGEVAILGKPLDKVIEQEKTIQDLRDVINNMKMIISVMENNYAILKRKFDRLEVSLNSRLTDTDRRRKEKTMKRFRITNGRHAQKWGVN